MRTRSLASICFLVLTALQANSQSASSASTGNGQPGYARPMPMPGDRAAESYTIYSQLLKSGPIEWRDAKRTQWLVEDATNATPLELPCTPTSEAGPTTMNPHEAVEAPVDRQAEWGEVLADYDQHCHDVIELDPYSFKTELPVRLLNTEEKDRFMGSMETQIQPPSEFSNGAGLHRFTEVFFNANHTLALVEEGMWCGGSCGNWTWVTLERKDDRWEMLPWVRMAAGS